MAKQSRASRSVFGWRWLFILFAGVTWLSVGCNPQLISFMLMPFQDNNIQPEYKLFAEDKEITLVIMTEVVHSGNRIQPELQAADVELADQLLLAFRKRCEDNKHRIKIIPTAQVRQQQLAKLNGGALTAVEIGRHFKADYVLEVSMNSLSLYEKDFYPPMHRGRSNLNVSLYKVKTKDGDDHKVHEREVLRAFPKDSPPIDATSTTPSQFRTLFMRTLANDVAKMFVSYPPEEKRMLE